MTTASLHIRLDQDIKAEAMRVLTDMGTSVTAVVRDFLVRIASNKALPYEESDGLPSEEELRIAQEQVYVKYPELRGMEFKNRAFDLP